MAKSTQDLVIFIRALQDAMDRTDLSVQIFPDKSYRIYDGDGGILLDSENADKHEDINDLPYATVEEIKEAILSATNTTDNEDT